MGVHANYLLFLSDFNEISIFSIDCRKISNVKFLENYCSGSRVPEFLVEGRTERHDVANSRFSQFCECV